MKKLLEIIAASMLAFATPALADAGQRLEKIPTFLGNSQRRFYGKGPVPEKLEVIWKTYVGGGKTNGKKTCKWFGTGWTGQPVLIEENGKNYVIVGAYDYNLRKIDAGTGKVIWKYSFDDIIKSTPTIFSDEKSSLILAGSRRGFGKSLDDKEIFSFRALSLEGKELWRLNIEQTQSYSRDVDGSALVLEKLIFLGAENGLLYVINPNKTAKKDGFVQPEIIKTLKLYEGKDVKRHKGNLVIESSPASLEDRIYVTAGSGHVYGINKKNYEIEWDFFVGADLNGSPVITKEGHLLISVEKQYIKGKGGVLKLDPKKAPSDAVEWFFPTKDREFSSWKGGVIGSVAINDEYIDEKNENRENEKRRLAAFSAIDGNLYVVSQIQLDNKTVLGPNENKRYATPKLFFKKNIGGSISTPIFVDDCLIAAGYDSKLHIFKIDYKTMKIDEICSFKAGNIESTPIVWNKKVYIGSRDGYFYCLGEKEQGEEIKPLSSRP